MPAEIKSAYAQSALSIIEQRMEEIFAAHTACLDRADGTGMPLDHIQSCRAKLTKHDLDAQGSQTWRAVLEVAVCETFDHVGEDDLEDCLATVAAVTALWIRTLKMRRKKINGC